MTENLKSTKYPDLEPRPFALIQHFGGEVENSRIVEIVRAQGAQAAKDYFDKKYPGRMDDGMKVWLLVGNEIE